MSRRVPVLCKVAPAKSDVHMEDVHRAGGIMSILGELDKAGSSGATFQPSHSRTLGEALERWDIGRTRSESVREFYRAAPAACPPGGLQPVAALGRSRPRRETGVIRSAARILSRRMAGLRYSTAISPRRVAS